MIAILKIAPVVILFLFAAIAVWRGFDRRPDGSKNKRNIGGGPWHGPSGRP